MPALPLPHSPAPGRKAPKSHVVLSRILATLSLNMRLHRRTLLVLITVAAAWAQDPKELVRRSIAQDQLDWMRMKDYTWQAHSVEKHLDSRGKVESTKREAWETLMLDGQPYRRTLERDGKPLNPEEERGEQKKLDR